VLKRSEHRSLVVQLFIMAVAMFGFGYLLVPLYDVFCEITGFGGRTNAVAAVVEEAPDLTREIRVEFVTTVNEYAQFEFAADADSMTVSPGKISRGRIRSRRRYRALRLPLRLSTSQRLSVFVLRARNSWRMRNGLCLCSSSLTPSCPITSTRSLCNIRFLIPLPWRRI
jgi:hypothetical protein